MSATSDETVTHREMGNNSGEILPAVTGGVRADHEPWPACRGHLAPAGTVVYRSRPRTSSMTRAVAGDRLPRYVCGDEAPGRGGRVAGADPPPAVGAGPRRSRVVVAAHRTARRGRPSSGRRRQG